MAASLDAKSQPYGGRGRQQPSDLLELVPLKQAPDRSLRAHGAWHYRQAAHDGRFPALFDRKRCQGVCACLAARTGQDLGVVQEAASIHRRRNGAGDGLRTRR